MSEAEWQDADDPRVREAFGYSLRAHVRYQDGADSEAPALIFADYDYEVGDGSCGLHEDGKRANEPAIVYVRADAHLALRAKMESLARERDRAVEALAEPKWQSVDRDNMEFAARITCWQMDRIRAALSEIDTESEGER